jgi:deoxyadenosine/deoxycytidine kinase
VTLNIIPKVSSKDRQAMPRYIAVEGPIGAGKTTLARHLAFALDYPSLFEPVVDNPFLERFYNDHSADLALPTQLYFLLHRTQQIAEIPVNDLLGPTLITDFLAEKDRIFAEVTLNKDELALYNQISSALFKKGPAPDLVIYLQAPVPILKKRIQSRGLHFEQAIETNYLESLVEKYTEFFHDYHETPLLIINAESIDFANNVDHFQSLVNQIILMDGSRHFFNPNPLFI